MSINDKLGVEKEGFTLIPMEVLIEFMHDTLCPMPLFHGNERERVEARLLYIKLMAEACELVANMTCSLDDPGDVKYLKGQIEKRINAGIALIGYDPIIGGGHNVMYDDGYERPKIHKYNGDEVEV